MLRVGAALASVLVLAACGGGTGGSSGGGGTVVSPTPTPVATASPTPTPAASYTKFASLTGNQNFLATCNSLRVNFSPPVLNPVFAPGSGLDFAYLAATQNWTITGDGLNLRYGPAELDPASPTGSQFYSRPSTAPGVTGFTERLRILLGGAGGTPLEYFRLATIATAESGGGPSNYNCVFGVPTLTTDVPVATTVTYPKTALVGTAYRTQSGVTTNYSLTVNSTATMSVNLTTGEVTTVMHLIGAPAPSGSLVDLGTVTNVADIDAPTAGYYSQFLSDWSSAELRVQFAQVGGRFFGPQGVETGAIVTLVAEPVSAPPGDTLRVTATLIGIR